MTYDELRKLMLNGLQKDSTLYDSLNGIIGCCEKMGSSIEECAKILSNALPTKKETDNSEETNAGKAS